MTDAPVPLLKAPRLLLTWPSPEQIEDYFHAIVGTAMFDTLVWEGPSSPSELHDWWASIRARDPSDLHLDFNLAIIEQSSMRCIGGAGLRPLARDPRILDIGYTLAPHAQGQGYATEAVGTLVDEAFANREAERVFGGCFVGNHASRRVMEKLGFAFEGTQRRTVFKKGEWLDEWMMAITRPDWEALQSHPTEPS